MEPASEVRRGISDLPGDVLEVELDFFTNDDATAALDVAVEYDDFLLMALVISEVAE